MDPQPVPDLTPPAGPNRGLALPHRAGVLEPSALDDLIAEAVEAQMGHVRLDVPWSLAQPSAGRIDGSVFETLATASHAARAAGLAVWFRLLQPDVPRWFDNDGGFGDDRTAGTHWPRWVDLVAERLGAHADGWVPLEAPFGLVTRLAPGDPRRQGELLHTVVVAWRDAWRGLRGGVPVATSLDLAIERPLDERPESIAEARRRDDMRWYTWFGGLRDGVVRIPGRAERVLDDLDQSCDQIGVALAADPAQERDLEDLLARVGEQRLQAPVALTLRATGTSAGERQESIERMESRLVGLYSEANLARLTLLR